MRQRIALSTAKSKEILAHWRRERAFRVGHILGLAGLVLTLVTTAFDLYYSPLYVVLADLILVTGCALTWHWSRRSQRKSYFWYPLYFGYWFACIPSFWITGGVSGPFFGIGIALIYVLGEILDVKQRPRLHFLIAALHLPAFVLLEQFIPLKIDGGLPTYVIAIITGANLAGLYVGFRAVMKTEEELSFDFAERHAEIHESQAIAKVGSWSWNIPQDLVTWSDELFRMFEIKKENFDPSYKAYLARLSPEQRDHINRLIQKSAETGEDFIFEHVIETSVGRKNIFARGRVVKDLQGNVIGMVGTSQDITDRKKIEAELVLAREELEQRVAERTLQLEQSLEREKASREEAERASQAKMQFLANMSHEIRTPMNSILGFSELLATENYSPENTRELMERIRSNGDRLLRLIDDILDLSKFEAGQIPMKKTSVDLRALIANAVKSFEPSLQSKNLRIEIYIDHSIPEHVLLDETRASQVLVNLLSNSIKFSDQGVILIKASFHGHKIRIDVEDTGIGISAQNQESLFQLFSQGDSSVARKFGGSGLGLALSKRIAEAMGGSLELKWSERGKGSHFTFEVPFTAATRVARASSSTNPSAPISASGGGRRILLAEDSPDNAFLICHFIKPLGYIVDVATDGLQAVEAVARKEYDCILMDIQMPGMDGLEATRRIRAAGFVKPIIALTAHALPAETEKSLAAGCNDHLTKPISRSALASALSAQLDRPDTGL